MMNMFLKEDIKNIKVEILLNDLVHLQEIAKLYYVVSNERDTIQKQNIELKNEIENLKIIMSKNNINDFNVERNDFRESISRNDFQISAEAEIK